MALFASLTVACATDELDVAGRYLVVMRDGAAATTLLPDRADPRMADARLQYIPEGSRRASTTRSARRSPPIRTCSPSSPTG